MHEKAEKDRKIAWAATANDRRPHGIGKKIAPATKKAFSQICENAFALMLLFFDGLYHKSQLVQIFGWHRRWTLGHQIGGVLHLGEGDDIPYGILF